MPTLKTIQKLTLMLIPFLALLAYGLFLAHPINLVTADLGRHIKNGELIIKGDFSILKRNLYSYTYPDFAATNHHWLGGVVLYLVWKFFGVAGSHIFFILLSLAAFYIFFVVAQSRAGPGWAGLLSVLTIPLLLERNEIRPEVFSYIFSGIFLWLLFKYRRGEISWKKLWILPLVQVLWVNLHIYFFLGPVIVGAFLLENLIFKATRAAKHLTLILALILLADLINPFGLKGVLAPLNIFNNFGYRLAENQPVWFIEKLLPNPNYLIFKIAFLILILSLAARIMRFRFYAGLIPDAIFALGFSLAGWLAIRNFAIFGLFALPLIASNLAAVFKLKPENEHWLNRTALTTLALVVVIILSGELKAVYPRQQDLRLGLEKDNYKALDFFKANKLAGPIFNNYDIGSYLIYGLYPQEKVFVDNRPEAYPAEFFSKTYIPMQADKKVWDENNALYKFNAIIFSYRDYTPWGQTFFARILNDPEWKAVFADDRVVIFLKDNKTNKNIIAQFGRTLKIKRAEKN